MDARTWDDWTTFWYQCPPASGLFYKSNLKTFRLAGSRLAYYI